MKTITLYSIILVLLFTAWTPADHTTVAGVAATPAPTPTVRPTIESIPAYFLSDKLITVLTGSLLRLKTCAPDMYAYVHDNVFLFMVDHSNNASQNGVVGLSDEQTFEGFEFQGIDQYHGMILLVHEARHIGRWVEPGDEIDANEFTLPLFDRCPPTDEERAAVGEYRLLIEKRAGHWN